jgi:3-deoxy-D-manno-octulosonate 8-phosphate phosphatase (KDO 8-P phosphatase)
VIKLIVLDVDGTMTNGKITYTNTNEELKSFCVKDGLAIASWIKLGLHVAIVTGRESQIVANRAKELKIKYLFQKIKDKDKKVQEILDELNIGWESVAAIGDDLNDYNMLKRAKISFAPNNAVDFIKDSVDIKLGKDGGDGAVREMIEYLIKLNNMQKDFYKIWEIK